MKLLIDAFWRACAYCLRPGVMLLSLLPLLLMGVAAVSLGYFFWEDALDKVRVVLDSSEFVNHGWAWLDHMGLGGIKTVLAPLVVVFTVTPLIVVACLLVVALLMTPWLVRLVAKRRFPALQALGNTTWLGSLAWSLGSTALALVALLISIPLWFVPPLVLVLPPLIWGWLTYRVMAFDALSEHATPDERRTLLRRHRPVLLCMGIISGFLGAAPSLLWASVAVFAAMFVVLLPLALWVYTLVFAFSSLWFAHYCLSALSALREAQVQDSTVVDIELPGAPSRNLPDMRQTPGPIL
ncbi:MAG: hypothetical protein CFE44_24370 [Burkholderiales bacterium PBB4]|nr:MAG: hypothetical protein CFE44_24370 [Burkholderiales bacterium PBB4]